MPEPLCVPSAASPPERRENRLWDPLGEAVMKSQLHRDAATDGEGNVVAGGLNPLKPAARLELGQAVPLFPAVTKTGIHEVRNLSLGARSHGLGNHRVGRSLIAVDHLGQDLHHASLLTIPVNNHLDESKQLSFT